LAEEKFKNIGNINDQGTNEYLNIISTMEVREKNLKDMVDSLQN
jgi:hypothetical protein